MHDRELLVFDTDVLSLVIDRHRPGLLAQARADATGLPQAITIVSVEEQFRGRVAYCARAKTPEQYAIGAGYLRTTLDAMLGRTVLDFSPAAADHFRRLKAAKVRVGTPDLRIAAIVLAHRATLITRNLRDFGRVPELRAEDWTCDPA